LAAIEETAPMQTDNRILDDIARLASGMMGVAAGMRGEVEGVFKARLQALLADMDLVPREDFEVVRAMAVKAREENEALAARVAALEAALAAQPKPARPASAGKSARK
jgi:hypothetical protein